MKPDYCPNCGSEVPARARACPECGSCPETGWSEETAADGLDLPDESFDYDEYVRKEFGGSGPEMLPPGMKRFWWGVAVVLVLILLGWGLFL